MLHLAGAIILAFILWHVFCFLFALALSGFAESTATGCFTVVVFGGVIVVICALIFG